MFEGSRTQQGELHDTSSILVKVDATELALTTISSIYIMQSYVRHRETHGFCEDTQIVGILENIT